MKKIAVGDLGEFWYGDYKEPFEQLEGGVPGHPVGVVLKSDDGKLLCAFCGKTYENLGSHVNWTHGLRASAYKDEVGLLRKSALVSDRLRMVHSRTAASVGLPANPQNIKRGNLKGSHHARPDGRSKPEGRNKTGRCYAQVIAVGRTVVRETGRLSERSLRKHGIFDNTIRTYFGTMDGFRKAIGVPEVGFRRWQDDELLQALRSLAQEIGRTPSASDIKRYGLPSLHAYRDHFGSINEACLRAGLFVLPAPDPRDVDQTILTTYATLGSISRTARHLHMDRTRIESVFTAYGAPLPEYSGHERTRQRREWAAEMARRLAGMADAA